MRRKKHFYLDELYLSSKIIWIFVIFNETQTNRVNPDKLLLISVSGARLHVCRMLLSLLSYGRRAVCAKIPI